MDDQEPKDWKEPKPTFLFGWYALNLLREAGLVGVGVQRVVIDIKHDDYARLYIQKALDTKALEVLIGEPGIEIITKELD